MIWLAALFAPRRRVPPTPIYLNIWFQIIHNGTCFCSTMTSILTKKKLRVNRKNQITLNIPFFKFYIQIIVITCISLLSELYIVINFLKHLLKLK